MSSRCGSRSRWSRPSVAGHLPLRQARRPVLRHWKLLPACALCVLGMAGLLSGRTLEPDAGVLVTDAPRQAPTAAAPFRILDYELTPRAAYDIEARVLGIERYRDESAPLSPLDLAVG